MFICFRNIKISVLLGLIFLRALNASGQYSPAAGQSGSDAIYKTDSRFVEWANDCKVTRGFIQISDTTVTDTEGDITSNRAFYGSEQSAVGAPKGGMDVVSLGDKGSAMVTFDKPIKNGSGPDFAIFENALQEADPPYQYFIELAFVEVSSDGQRFVRFPAVSLTPADVQIATFGQIDPTKIYNLAGKYTADYGTPFDLEDLKDSSGINPDSITHIRIIDVGGSIDPTFASYDSQGHIINDPYPTPFWNCGFDLQAVGALNVSDVALATKEIINQQNTLSLYPNPILSGHTLSVSIPEKASPDCMFTLTDMTGKVVIEQTLAITDVYTSIYLPDLSSGIYIVSIRSNSQVYKNRLVIKN